MARRCGRKPALERRQHRRVDGTVTQMWSVRYFDAEGHRRRVSCRSLAEAQCERERISIETFVSSEGLTLLRDFWPVWLYDARARVQPNTVAGYERTWRLRVEPHLGDLQMRHIRPRVVAQWRARLLADGDSAECVRRAMWLLQAIFTIALEWGEARDNPVRMVRKPKQQPRRAVTPLAPEDVERMRALLLERGDLQSATLVSVLAYAGLRPGEALGLQVRHIRERTLLIEQAAARGRLTAQKTGRRYRTVDLLPILRRDLHVWLLDSPDPARDRLVFGRPDGRPWSVDDWNNWRNRTFRPIARCCGLADTRPYDLRHSFASLMIREQRVSIVDLAEQLGHSPSLTLGTYGHVMSEFRRAEPREVNAWIAGARRACASRQDRGGLPPDTVSTAQSLAARVDGTRQMGSDLPWLSTAARQGLRAVAYGRAEPRPLL